MTREEVIRLLKTLIANYPHTKITDASATATAWEMILGEYDVEPIYKAARLHMSTSPYFPTPSDLVDKIVRAQVLYNQPTVMSIEAPKRAKVTVIPDGVSVEDFLDHICQDMIDLENECWPEATQDETIGGCLPYET